MSQVTLMQARRRSEFPPPRIEETEFGKLIYVEGEGDWMAVEALDAINKANPGSVMVQGVAMTFNAFMAICPKDKAEAWIAYAAQHAKNISNGDPETEWVKGPFTGLSSETIFSVLADHRAFYHLADPARVHKLRAQSEKIQQAYVKEALNRIGEK